VVDAFAESTSGSAGGASDEGLTADNGRQVVAVHRLEQPMHQLHDAQSSDQTVSPSHLRDALLLFGVVDGLRRQCVDSALRRARRLGLNTSRTTQRQLSLPSLRTT